MTTSSPAIVPVSSQDSTSKRDALRAAKKRQDAASLVQFLVIGCSGATLLLQLLLFGAFAKLASKPAPSLVQLQTGESIAVTATDSKAREPENIKRFVADSLILLMSWHNQLPAQRDANGTLLPPGTDPGMALNVEGKTLRLTSPAYQASFAFDEVFREELVNLLATSTPHEVFTGQVQTLLSFQAITEPEEIEPGRWQLSVVGNLIRARVGTAETESEPFNRQITVRAIDTPPLPEDGEFSSSVALAVHGIRRAGLEIESMEALDDSLTSSLP